MRSVIAAAAFAAVLFAAAAAQADKRIFIIANNADGYGIDRCLASYCRAREFAQALSYRKVARDDMTGVIPAACRATDCDDFVAIECSR